MDTVSHNFLPYWLQYVTAWAGIISVVVAIITYWSERIRNRKKNSKLKERLKVELRTLLFGVNDEIVRYGHVKEGYKPGMNTNFCRHTYSIPVLRFLVQTTKDSDIFDDQGTHSSLAAILHTIDLIEKEGNSFQQLQIIKMLDFYIGKRVLEIRNLVLLFTDVLDLNPMPENFKGIQISENDIEKHKQHQRQSKDAEKFIRMYFSTIAYNADPSKQYFGEDI